MDGRGGDNSDTKFIDALFDGRYGLYLDAYYAEVEDVELINKVLHE